MKAQEHRVLCGQPRHLDEQWGRVARRYAREHGLEVRGVLDMFDEIAHLCVYGGDSWDVAQARGWEQTTAILDAQCAGRRVA